MTCYVRHFTDLKDFTDFTDFTDLLAACSFLILLQSYCYYFFLPMAEVQMIDTDELAKCPHCDKELDKIEKSTKGFLHTHTI